MRVKQVENVLDLIELFAREKSPRTLTSLSAKLGMPKSSTFNLIDTLVARGFLYQAQPRSGYYPTRRLLDLSRDIVEGDGFLQRLHGELASLAANTGETVLLAVRDQGEVVYVDVVESSALIRYFAKVGERRPLYATSSGKAILTSYGEAERTAILQSLTYVTHEKTTAGNSQELAANLELSIQRGWCEDQAEYTPDVMGISVPVVHDERRFGLAVAGPMFRMQDRRTELAALLLATATRMQAIMEE